MIQKALLALLLSSSIMSTAMAADDDILGQAGETTISVEDVRKRLELLPQADRAALASDTGKLAQVVRGYIGERAVLKAARDANFDRQPAIAAKLDQTRDTLLTELFLQSKINIPDDYPSESELQAFYAANRSALVPPRRYHLAQIFIAAPKEEKTSDRVEEVLKKVKAKGADFTALAKTYTDSPAEAPKGGEIGWIVESSIAPEIRQAIAGREKGTITPAIRLTDGWHIINILDIKQAGTDPVPLATVKDQLVKQMRQQRVANEQQAFLSQLFQKQGIVLNELALKKLAPSLK